MCKPLCRLYIFLVREYTMLMSSDNKIYSVGELVSQIRLNLEKQHPFVIVEGEVTNYAKHHGSGHVYFALSEAGALLQCICWKSVKIPTLKDGEKVCCTGKITAYVGRSQFQLNITSVSIQGKGNLFKLFEEMKVKLSAEGLFDQSRKRKLTAIPKVIGIITAADGDALQDILARLKDRVSCKIIVWPVAVQGAKAADMIVQAIHGFNQMQNEYSDVLSVQNRVIYEMNEVHERSDMDNNPGMHQDEILENTNRLEHGNMQHISFDIYAKQHEDNIENVEIPNELRMSLDQRQAKMQGNDNVQMRSEMAQNQAKLYLQDNDNIQMQQKLHLSIEQQKRPDVLIITRGGGSLEDLWAFNEESVVRAIASSEIHTLTAVGHEMDYTLADFVSDIRAPTPTASIEILLPTREEMYEKLHKTNMFLAKILTEFIDKQQQSLRMMMELHEHMVENLYLTRIQQLDYAMEKLDRCISDKIRSSKETLPKIFTLDAILQLNIEKMTAVFDRFSRTVMNKTADESIKLKNLESVFEGFSYEKVLKRGFCLVTANGANVVQTAQEARKIGKVELQFSDDRVLAKVE